MTRLPRCSDSATFSAACRHTVQDRNSGSPSFHSPDALSMNRGVEATRNLATAAPDGVNRNSGSSVRLPMTVMVVSPAMTISSRTHQIPPYRLSEPYDRADEADPGEPGL